MWEGNYYSEKYFHENFQVKTSIDGEKNKIGYS